MKILVLPGDGIGPEITDATLRVLEVADRAFELGLEYEIADIGLKSLEEQGTTLPDAVLERIPEVDGVILGPVSHYDYPTRAGRGVSIPRRSSACDSELYRQRSSLPLASRTVASCASPWT